VPTPVGLARLRGGGRPVERNSTVRTTSCPHDDVLGRRADLPSGENVAIRCCVVKGCGSDFFGRGNGHERFDVSVDCKAFDRPPRPAILGRLSFDPGVHALDLGLQAADFVLELEDSFDPGDVDSGVGEGSYLA